MLHSFGGKTKLIPAVKTKCMITNDDRVKNETIQQQQMKTIVDLFLFVKCLICTKQPVGDYYQYRQEILCSSCFNFNWQWEEKFKRTSVIFVAREPTSFSFRIDQCSV